MNAFAAEHLDAAASLLIRRHERHRLAEPLLAEIGDHASVRRGLGSRLERGASGGVAFAGGRLAAFVLGMAAENEQWGPHVWVDRMSAAATDAEALRDAYATAAEQWMSDGRRRHFVNVPSLPEDLDPWYRLGFAQMHQDAIRETGGEATVPAGVAIRRGGLDDLETAIRVGRGIAETQARTPSFWDLQPGDDLDDWVETLVDPEVWWFVAERDGEPLGHATLYEPAYDFGIPPDSIFLASTATLPEARGLGVGLALTEHALAWAREAGYRTMVTNWRVTNLLASRYWPARGFRPTYVRLHRAPGIA